MNKPSLLFISALSTLLLTTPLAAYEAGDVIVRVDAAHVAPNDDSGPVLAAGDGVSVDSKTGVGIATTLMLTDQIGVELLAALPFEHDINAEGDLAALGNIGSTKHLPPTLSAQYYFSQTGNMTPYVGFGLNYTLFFEEETTASLTNALGATSTNLSLSNSFGVSAHAGIDWTINDNWGINTALYYMAIDTEADVIVDGVKATTVDVDIDPLVFMLGVSYKF